MEQPKQKHTLESLNSQFHVSLGGGWLWNKNPGLYIGDVDRKVLFLFNGGDAGKLTDCPFVAKIGNNNNRDTNAEYPFIGFAYGDKQSSEELINFAKQFPSAEIIEGLTDTWVSKSNVKVTKLN